MLISVDSENSVPKYINADELNLEGDFQEFKRTLAKKAFDPARMEETKDFRIELTLESENVQFAREISPNNFADLIHDNNCLVGIKIETSKAHAQAHKAAFSQPREAFAVKEPERRPNVAKQDLPDRKKEVIVAPPGVPR